MKNFSRTIIIIALAVISTAGVSAQNKGKFGHLNSNDLLLQMPERKEAEKKLQDYAKQLEGQLSTMTTEYQNKLADYQANQATMASSVKQAKAEEIANLERRIQQFQMSAQEDLQTKETELLQPLIDKAKKAIKEVADENGYSYVFDTSTGALLHFPEGDDLMPSVKKKLGLN